MKIAVFDFDGTIYRNDSFIRFCLYIYQKRPLRAFYIFFQLLLFLQFKLKLINAFKFKNSFLSYLNGISAVELEGLTKDFWAKSKQSQFNQNVLKEISEEKNKGNTIVCISASPYFLLNHFVKSLGFDDLICTKSITLENKTSLVGKNCRGKEKIEQLKIKFPSNPPISLAISDNLDDAELLQLAEKKIQIINSKLVVLP